MKLFRKKNLLVLIMVFAMILGSDLSPKLSYGAGVGTPITSAKPKVILNPAFPATFYYTTDDNITIFDNIELYNFDSRDVTVELVGEVENSEGWFAFSTTSVVVPADTWNPPLEVPFSITIPDGVCEDVYEGFVKAIISDYDGYDPSGGMMASSTIAVQALFDMVTGVPCVGGEVLPGLGAAPSYLPPDAVTGEVGVVVEDDTGGGGGIIIPPPPPPPPPPEEEELVTINVLAYPEKRIPKTGNWGTRGGLKLFEGGNAPIDYDFAVTTADSGAGSTEQELLPAVYDISFKGLSHLTKYMRDVDMTDAPSTYNLDFTFGDTFDLLAGDVHLSKDDFVNSLDLSATVNVLYQNEEHADLNKDGMVNALDLSIEVINLYENGEEL